MTVAAVESPEDVLTLLRRQASLYAGLESLATRQRSLVTEDEVSPLLGLLGERQKLSQELSVIATSLAPSRKEWAVYRRRFTPSQRTEAERLLQDINGRLQRIIETDEHDARVLSARKQAVAQTLRATHSTSQAISAYRAPTSRPRRLDCIDEGG
jgi:hypothetical protein